MRAHRRLTLFLILCGMVLGCSREGWQVSSREGWSREGWSREREQQRKGATLPDIEEAR
jgi:hypothetical protein